MIYLMLEHALLFYNEELEHDVRVNAGHLLVAGHEDADDFRWIRLATAPHVNRHYIPKDFARKLAPLEVLALQAE